ncbi:MAG: ABC transporter permease [Desulfarculales bacterium]|nr:ABC transporter permease [Desulfarculales bacterium]
MRFLDSFLGKIGGWVLAGLNQSGGMLIFFLKSLFWLLRPPFRFRLLFRQMEFVGVKSINVVILTGLFTGAVFALQSYYGFAMFGAESLVGSTVALALTRELAPVLTSLMVTGRAGSAMAAEIGTMRVTEQIDALTAMAVNPIQYLVAPRMLAGIIMLPLLTVLTNYIGILGSYVVGVKMLDISEGIFVQNIYTYLAMTDITMGLIKAAVFGLILSVVGCYQGYVTAGGAEGVGRATTRAVVLACILILATDYFLTAVMF